MALIRPFRALRFTEKAGKIEELTCPPYDIISESQRLGYLKRNENNIIRLELPRDGGDPYQTAGETLRRWIDEDILRKDDAPAFYVYAIDFTVGAEEKTIFGLIAQVHLEEFSKGIVLPHEETLSKAKADRMELMKATGCNFSDVYSLYMDDGGESEVNDILRIAMQEQPLCSMTDEAGLIHTLWAIRDESTIAAIQTRFADKELYIADGHHRYETALNYRNYLRAEGVPEGTDADYIMMMLVQMDHPGLVVFPTHRMIRGLPQFSSETVLRGCEDMFQITTGLELDSMDEIMEECYAAEKKAIAFYDGGDTFALLILKDTAVMDTFLPDCSATYRQLDVNVLHVLILERLLGIDKANMANQTNLTYTRNLQEAIDNVRAGIYQCSFVINPTRVSEIGDVAKAGEKMPQKSTYFYPKLITGLTMNQLK